MTNKEKYKEEILDYLINCSDIAIDKKTGTVCDCSFQIGCSWCAFCNEDENCCERNKTKWLNEEYVEPKVDWSKVPVDTPVLVSQNGSTWFKRYFAGFDKGVVSAWNQGATSWSSDFDDDTTKWTYAKLAESEENVE